MSNHLKAWRKYRDMSGDKLAAAVKEKTGHQTDKTQISKLERGERKLTTEWLRLLSEALDCQPGDLLRPPPHASSPELHAGVNVPLTTETQNGHSGETRGEHRMMENPFARMALKLLESLGDDEAVDVIDAYIDRHKQAKESGLARPPKRARTS